MFLGDRKDDIEATNNEVEAKDQLERVIELADKVKITIQLWYVYVHMYLHVNLILITKNLTGQYNTY